MLERKIRRFELTVGILGGDTDGDDVTPGTRGWLEFLTIQCVFRKPRRCGTDAGTLGDTDDVVHVGTVAVG